LLLETSNGAPISYYEQIYLQWSDPPPEEESTPPITETIYEFPHASRGELSRKRAVSVKRGSYSAGTAAFGDRRLGPDKVELRFGVSGMGEELAYKQEIERILTLLSHDDPYHRLYLLEGSRRLPISLGDTVTENPGSAHEASLGSLVVSMDVRGSWEALTVSTVTETLADGDNTGLAFTNAGSLYAYPIWHLAAAGATEIIIIADGRTFTWTNEAGLLSGELTIDTLRGEIRGLTDSQNDVANGAQLPILPPGNSTYDVTLTGGGADLTILYRERYL
jgi:hypothetical protein